MSKRLFYEDFCLWCIQSEGITHWLKELDQLKLSKSTESTTVDQLIYIYIKSTRSSVECWDHCDVTK